LLNHVQKAFEREIWLLEELHFDGLVQNIGQGRVGLGCAALGQREQGGEG